MSVLFGVLVVSVGLIGGGWTPSGEASVPPSPARPSLTSPLEEPAAAGSVVDGATTTVVFPQDRGTLWVAVQRKVQSDGREVASVMVERGGACTLHRVHGNNYNADCGVLWTVERKIPSEAFNPNPAMGEATLDLRVKGKRLRVNWRGQGAPNISTDPANGYVFLQTQEAKAGVRWGTAAWAWPDDFGSKHAGTGLLYRRIEEEP